MTLDEYQQQAIKTAVYTDDSFKDLLHWILGLSGEAGEVADKMKKILRDKNGQLDSNDKHEISKELGDVLWYVAVLARHMDINLEDVAKLNQSKLNSRYQRGKIAGSGDNR